MTGPLAGLRVLELAGVGPAPHAAMILADLGADVARIERPASPAAAYQPPRHDYLLRGRRSAALDLKTAEGRAQVMRLVGAADVFIEGYRPGVAERLGVGPAECCAVNPRLIYARVTGFGQSGPLSQHAGHDINYIAVTGVLNAFGPAGERPVPPLNLLGDFGGGSMLMLVGILSALWERTASGRGQIIDAAMVDGVSLLAQMIWSSYGTGRWNAEPGTNVLDGGAPYYGTYRCADGKFVAVGAIESPFWAALLEGLGVEESTLPDRDDPRSWPTIRKQFEELFAARSRDEWCAAFGPDACVTPVLSFDEATAHSHLAGRGSLIDLEGVTQSAPAPRFSRTSPAFPAAPPEPGLDTEKILADWLGSAAPPP